MEFRVLGPLEAREDDRSFPLGGAKQRALLVLLLLNANRVVSRERLIDELWGEEPPETAVASLQVYVSRLRNVLGADVLVTQPPGYLLGVAPDELDVDRFDRLRAAGQPEEALAAPHWRSSGSRPADRSAVAGACRGALMEYRVLGPLEVVDGDRPLPLGGEKQRALLALLLVNANRVVSRERMIDESATHRSRQRECKVAA
jgi:DNA-binding SARP family transcriptional activator